MHENGDSAAERHRFMLGSKNFYLQPINMTRIVKIFSASVFAATLPNPTLVKLLNVKYKAVTYFAWKTPYM